MIWPKVTKPINVELGILDPKDKSLSWVHVSLLLRNYASLGETLTYSSSLNCSFVGVAMTLENPSTHSLSAPSLHTPAIVPGCIP